MFFEYILPIYFFSSKMISKRKHLIKNCFIRHRDFDFIFKIAIGDIQKVRSLKIPEL